MFNVFRHSVLCVWLAIVIFPIYWIVLISFKGPAEWNVWPPTYWPDSPTLFNYLQVWVNDLATGSGNGGLADVIGPWESLTNTFVIALVASTLATVAGTIIA